jgi:hypothetical protein
LKTTLQTGFVWLYCFFKLMIIVFIMNLIKITTFFVSYIYILIEFTLINSNLTD